MEFTKEDFDKLITFGIGIPMNNAASLLGIDPNTDLAFKAFKGQVATEYYKYLLGIALDDGAV